MVDGTYDPQVGDVVLVDSQDRRVRGMWIIKRQKLNGNFVIQRYGMPKDLRARRRLVVKPTFLRKLVKAVIATVTITSTEVD